jgi:drug/metabolite transporter (DMT)-like permease
VNKVMGGTEWALLLVLSVLWGGSFFFISVAVLGLPPFTIMLLRVGVAALLLWPVLLLTGQSVPAKAGVWAALAVMGIMNNVIPQTLIVWGEMHISGGLASILNATTPLFGVVVAHTFTVDEKITRAKLAGLAVGFFGVAVMMGPDALSGLGSNVLAQLGILVASLFYGLSGVFGRRFRQMGVSPMATATGQLTASTLLLLPLTFIFEQPLSLPMPGWPVILSVLALAAVSTALAYVIFFRILATAGATNLLLVTFLIPVSAIFLGWLFMNEQLSLRHFIGMTGIAAGLVLIDGRLLRRPQPAN